MRRAIASFVLGLSLAGCGPRGAPPGGESELWLVDLWSDETLIVVGEPRRLTERPGYDNQPAFVAGGDSVLYVARFGDRTDVFRVDVTTGQTRQLTRSAEREFSPLPLADGGFSAIRIEADGRQRLWRYDAAGAAIEPLVLPTRERIRYYVWLEDGTLAMQLEHDPPSLVLVRPGAQRVEPVIDDVGRSLQRVPGRRAVSFVHKESETEWWIKCLDLDTGRIETVTRTLQGREDHAWTPSGALIQASDTRLFRFIPGLSERWEEIADFDAAGLVDISRIAINDAGNRMVLVAAPL